MPDVRIVARIVEDDESDGVFWRDGVRWLREGGKEVTIASLAPKLEGEFMARVEVAETFYATEREARRRSLTG